MEKRLMLISKKVMGKFSKGPFDPKFEQARWVTKKEASILRDLVRIVSPKTILESGTANGFSSCWLTSGGPKDVVTHTFDPVARPKIWHDLLLARERITFHNTEFKNLSKHVKDIQHPIVAFIDGNHGSGSVTEDWETLKPYLQSGDLVIFHDLNMRSVGRSWMRLEGELKSSTILNFSTERIMRAIFYNTKTIPATMDEDEPVVLKVESEMDWDTVKVKNTKWANSPKPWGAYQTKALHSSGECHLLYETAKRLGPGNYANLGVFRGMSVACLAFGLKEVGNGKVYAVDDYSLKGALNGYPEKMLNEFNKLGIKKYVKVCKGLTTEVVHDLTDKKFRFIFIDAGHRYRDIKADFELWSPLVESDGEIGIHDVEYTNIHKYIQEDVLRDWVQVDHIWRTKIFRRR